MAFDKYYNCECFKFPIFLYHLENCIKLKIFMEFYEYSIGSLKVKKKKRSLSICFMTNTDLSVPLPTRIRGSCDVQ